MAAYACSEGQPVRRRVHRRRARLRVQRARRSAGSPVAAETMSRGRAMPRCGADRRRHGRTAAGAGMTATMRGVEIDSFPASRVRNSQAHGVGRVVTLDSGGAWSNLGRNVVFVGPDLRPRALFGESAFSEDEPSQYDLDVHAILDLPDAGLVVALNHLGTVR